jgi:RimJ/RimL family protein N-acetyltransferase
MRHVHRRARAYSQPLIAKHLAQRGYLGQYHGQGVAARAVRLMTDYAHRVALIKRVVLQIEADNLASVGVARAAGYQLTDLAPSRVSNEGRSYTVLTWEHLSTG